jgi:hypothetical protein
VERRGRGMNDGQEMGKKYGKEGDKGTNQIK